MVTRLLESLGLFVGWRQQSDNESLFFIALNDWLLSQAGGAWDHPEPIRLLRGNRDVRTLAADYLALSVRSPRALSYLGPKRFLRHRRIDRLPARWGWKDPRNTYTLPIWLDVFPKAKVIHVCRHGVDVAHSLKVRHARILSARGARYRRLRWLYLLHAKRVGFTTSLRCAELEGGFTLWEEYVGEGRAQVRTRGALGIEVRYEDFLENPRRALRELADFCELDARPDEIEALCGQVRPDRAYAYRRSPDLLAFAESAKKRLAAFDY
jgi:hypothetical protein